MRKFFIRSGFLIAMCWPVTGLQAVGSIIHDGEYNFLKAQHGEKWDAEDIATDKKLEAIRMQNNGKRPNILYVLIDDASFAQSQ